MAKILIGADPELCIFDGRTGQPVPAWEVTSGLKRGDKEGLVMPQVPGLNMHADGVALEFNFDPVVPTNFQSAVSFSTAAIAEHVQKKNKNYRLSYQGAITGYNAKALAHPLANEMGCDEDFSAYADNPRTARNVSGWKAEIEKIATGVKFFGGHIHVGYDKSKCPPWAAARLMDLFITMPLVGHDPLGGIRGKFYGAPGSYRPKPYGVEYRSLSNFWVRHRDITRMIASRIEKLFTAIEDDTDVVFDFYRKLDWTPVPKLLLGEGRSGDWFYDNTQNLRQHMDPQGRIW